MAASGGSAGRRVGGTGRAFALTRPSRLDLETFARATGTHPDLVTRLVALGLLDAEQDAAGRWRFPHGQIEVMSRIQRLRTAFGLNYAAVGLVLELLDRVEDTRSRHRWPQRDGGPP